MSRCLGALFAALLLAYASSGAAQERSLDLERFRPAADRYGFLGVPGTRTPGEWAWNAVWVSGYQLRPLTVRRLDDGSATSIVAHRVSSELISQLGISDRGAIAVHVPTIPYQDADAGPLGGPAIAALAIRDPYVSARVRFWGDAATPPHARHEGEGLAAQVGVTLPFGLEDNFAGEGAPQLDVQVIGDFHILDFGIGGALGYRHRFGEPQLLGVTFTNELFLGLALKVPTIVVPNLSAMVEFRLTTAADVALFSEASTAAEGEIGARWAEGDVALTWAVGMGFNAGVGVPAVRALFGVEFAPRTHDADGDAIEDGDDACQRLPEDVDGFEDEDGCPDPDNDDDFVPDEEDECPLEAAEVGRDEDEDGCTDPIVDSDGDGIEDRDDACPSAAEDIDDFDDEDGCPDPDDDADGVPDVSDRCRRDPEDADGFEDEDGCPDPDNDADGVGDENDRCPSEPEDDDDFDDDDGCPDPDNDRDGVLDASDQCPDGLETINGRDDDDGCADRGGRVRWRPTGDGDLPPLSGRVRFSAAGALRSSASRAIAQLAMHLRARWGHENRVMVAGDDARRVEALREALLGAGLSSAAFTVTLDAELPASTVALITAR